MKKDKEIKDLETKIILFKEISVKKEKLNSELENMIQENAILQEELIKAKEIIKVKDNYAVKITKEQNTDITEIKNYKIKIEKLNEELILERKNNEKELEDKIKLMDENLKRRETEVVV